MSRLWRAPDRALSSPSRFPPPRPAVIGAPHRLGARRRRSERPPLLHADKRRGRVALCSRRPDGRQTGATFPADQQHEPAAAASKPAHGCMNDGRRQSGLRTTAKRPAAALKDRPSGASALRRRRKKKSAPSSRRLDRRRLARRRRRLSSRPAGPSRGRQPSAAGSQTSFDFDFCHSLLSLVIASRHQRGQFIGHSNIWMSS
jgi:hypothetical protein